MLSTISLSISSVMNWWKYSIGESTGRARRSVTLRVEPGGSPLNSCTVDVSSSLTHSALCLVTSRLFFLLFSRAGCCGDPGLVLGLLRLPGGRPRPRLTGTMAPGFSSAAGADPLGGGAGRARGRAPSCGGRVPSSESESVISDSSEDESWLSG